MTEGGGGRKPIIFALALIVSCRATDNGNTIAQNGHVAIGHIIQDGSFSPGRFSVGELDRNVENKKNQEYWNHPSIVDANTGDGSSSVSEETGNNYPQDNSSGKGRTVTGGNFPNSDIVNEVTPNVNDNINLSTWQQNASNLPISSTVPHPVVLLDEKDNQIHPDIVGFSTGDGTSIVIDKIIGGSYPDKSFSIGHGINNIDGDVKSANDVNLPVTTSSEKNSYEQGSKSTQSEKDESRRAYVTKGQNSDVRNNMSQAGKNNKIFKNRTENQFDQDRPKYELQNKFGQKRPNYETQKGSDVKIENGIITAYNSEVVNGPVTGGNFSPEIFYLGSPGPDGSDRVGGQSEGIPLSEAEQRPDEQIEQSEPKNVHNGLNATSEKYIIRADNGQIAIGRVTGGTFGLGSFTIGEPGRGPGGGQGGKILCNGQNGTDGGHKVAVDQITRGAEPGGNITTDEYISNTDDSLDQNNGSQKISDNQDQSSRRHNPPDFLDHNISEPKPPYPLNMNDLNLKDENADRKDLTEYRSQNPNWQITQNLEAQNTVEQTTHDFKEKNSNSQDPRNFQEQNATEQPYSFQDQNSNEEGPQDIQDAVGQRPQSFEYQNSDGPDSRDFQDQNAVEQGPYGFQEQETNIQSPRNFQDQDATGSRTHSFSEQNSNGQEPQDFPDKNPVEQGSFSFQEQYPDWQGARDVNIGTQETYDSGKQNPTLQSPRNLEPKNTVWQGFNNDNYHNQNNYRYSSNYFDDQNSDWQNPQGPYRKILTNNWQDPYNSQSQNNVYQGPYDAPDQSADRQGPYIFGGRNFDSQKPQIVRTNHYYLPNFGYRGQDYSQIGSNSFPHNNLCRCKTHFPAGQKSVQTYNYQEPYYTSRFSSYNPHEPNINPYWAPGHYYGQRWHYRLQGQNSDQQWRDPLQGQISSQLWPYHRQGQNSGQQWPHSLQGQNFGQQEPRPVQGQNSGQQWPHSLQGQYFGKQWPYPLQRQNSGQQWFHPLLEQNSGQQWPHLPQVQNSDQPYPLQGQNSIYHLPRPKSDQQWDYGTQGLNRGQWTVMSE